MSKALAWVRKSKGDDDAVGLALQRREVFALGEELADEVDRLDLGIHTGFSTMSRDAGGMVDENDDVTAAVGRLEAGQYDYLVAYDDERVCRDDYFRVIEYAATQGGAELVYVDDVPDDDLTADIKRRVGRERKQNEIEKSRAAIEERKDRGYDHGRPKYGMSYNDDATKQVPGDDFGDVVDAIELRESGLTLEEISERTGISVSTVQRITDRVEWYRERADGRL